MRYALPLLLLLACSKAPTEGSGRGNFVDVVRKKSNEARKGKALIDLMGRITTAELEALKKIDAKNEAAILFLAGVQTLTPEQAADIAGANVQVVVANEMTNLDPKAAFLFGSYRGESLFLNGLTSVSPELAAALSGCGCKKLFLNGVKTLPAASATQLAGFGGQLISLRGLRTIDPAAAKALSAFGGSVAIKVGDDEPAGPKMTPEQRATLKKLSKAIVTGDVATIRAHLDAGGSPNLNERGTSLLMEACNFKKLEIATLLVSKGADVDAKNGDGMTALAYALDFPRFGRKVRKDPDEVLALAKMLLEAGAKVNPPKAAQAKRNERLMFQPPLLRAASLGFPKVVKLLLDAGADVNATAHRGGTALVEAINGGHVEVVKMLLDAGSVVDPEKPKMGGYPLHQAVSQPSIRLSMWRMKNTQGSPAEEKQLRADALEIIDLLVAKGAKVDRPNERGWTPLMAAINSGDVDLVKKIAKSGADLKRKDDKGNTPLHFAADLRRLDEKRLIPVVKTLLKLGAKKKAKNSDGKRAKALAKARGFKKLARLL